MSDYFEWNEAKLGLHVPEMDREHQALISLMNKLHVLREKKATAAEVLAAINALGEYTVKHFSDEEAYMARIQYPGIAVHKMVHKQLLAKFTGHQQAYKKDGKLTDDFFVFLKMWLNAHISSVDMKYSQHVAASAKSA
jgi:hemerythrin